jgi:hypothetical protein
VKDWRERSLGNRLKELIRHEEWNVGIVHAPIHSFLERTSEVEVQWLPVLNGERFLADPFGIVHNQAMFVFCEEYDFRAGKGAISCVDLSRSVPSPEIVINLPIHASYPYVLEHGGNVYCIPETYHAREISLYKAEEFPRRWVKKATLIRDFPGVDSTVFQFDGRWWLLCTDFDQGTSDRLYVWHAAELLGPWEPHTANPVKVDLGSARPAGTPFVHEGQLYRPAQDCSQTYGGGVVISRISRLTPTEFKEEPVTRVEPPEGSPYLAGLHTLSALGDWTLIDGKRFTFVRSEFTRGARRERAIWARSAAGLLHRM